MISGQAARGAQRDRKLFPKQTRTEVAGNYQLRVMGREAVVTNGRLDFGNLERIFQGQAEWLAREP